MHALLLTLIAVAGAHGCDCAAPAADCACQSAGDCQTGCDACGDGRISMAAKMQMHRIAKQPTGCWWGMMPQTCYDPPYGCYPGTRYMNRYPAFHGNYYRTAYNYRNYFDYPWHAEMHEPTSLFSYNVEGSVPTQVPLPAHARKPAPQSPAGSYARKPGVPATPASAGPRANGYGMMQR